MDSLGQTDRTVMNGADGRFVPGNRASAGRTSKPAELRKALESAVTVDAITKLAGSLLTQANAGDVRAAKLLVDKLIPRIDVEQEISTRLELWKDRFLDELLYATDAQTLREKLTGGRLSPSEEQAELLSLLGSLQAFREAA